MYCKHEKNDENQFNCNMNYGLAMSSDDSILAILPLEGVLAILPNDKVLPEISEK